MSNTDQTDVAAILEALRAEVRARRMDQGEGEAGTALSAIERELHHALEQIEITRVVSAHWPLEGRGLYERAWVLLHKVVRRALRWYINPIVEQQNAFNDAAARSLRLLAEAHAELREQLAALRRERRDESLPPSGDGAPPVTGPQRLEEPTGPTTPPSPDQGLRPLHALLEERKTVSAHWELRGDTPLTRARALARRGLRQYLRWLINPIVEQQNACNAAIAAAVPPLIAANGELRARLAALRAGREAP